MGERKILADDVWPIVELIVDLRKHYGFDWSVEDIAVEFSKLVKCPYPTSLVWVNWVFDLMRQAHFE